MNKDLIISKYKELVEFYEERLAANAMFLHIHQIHETPENCAKGEKLRSELSLLQGQEPEDDGMFMITEDGVFPVDQSGIREDTVKIAENLYEQSEYICDTDITLKDCLAIVDYLKSNQ